MSFLHERAPSPLGASRVRRRRRDELHASGRAMFGAPKNVFLLCFSLATLAMAGTANAGGGPVASTTTSVSSNSPGDIVLYGQTFTLTASVYSFGTPVSEGIVSFQNNGIDFIGGGAIILSNGTAAFTVDPTSVGQMAITALYSGGSNFTGSSSPVLYETVEAHTNTSLSSNVGSVDSTGQLTLTATVHPVSAPGKPAGDVSFFDGATPLGTETLDGSDVATLQLNADLLSLGGNVITAVYLGDNGFLTSTSQGDSVTVTAPVTGGVPEPATWAMLIMGVAMIGFAARRRRVGAPLTA
jgi:hypothetical protein